MSVKPGTAFDGDRRITGIKAGILQFFTGRGRYFVRMYEIVVGRQSSYSRGGVDRTASAVWPYDRPSQLPDQSLEHDIQYHPISGHSEGLSRDVFTVCLDQLLSQPGNGVYTFIPGAGVILVRIKSRFSEMTRVDEHTVG